MAKKKIVSLAKGKLQNRKILKKGKVATVVINLPEQQIPKPVSHFASQVTQDRRNLFFNR